MISLESIQEAVRKEERTLYELCCELIKAKGENPPGNVTKVAEIVTKFLDTQDINYEWIEPKTSHVNVLAQIGKGQKKLLLCGHLDVVPAGERERWEFPPFCGEIKEGKILGRGSTDMKGGIASMLFALKIVKTYEEKLGGEIIVAFVCDEETGGNFGSKWLLRRKLLQGNACLITEPSAYLAAGYTIDAGEKGVYWLKFTSLGKQAHGSWPLMGENAILHLTSFLQKLKVLEERKVQTPKDTLKLIKNGKRILAKIAKERNIQIENLMKILDHYTVNIGIIKGGIKTNIVPDKCEAEVDIRIPIGGSKKDIEGFLKEILPPKIEYKVLAEAIPSYSSLNEPILQIVKKNAERVFHTKIPAIAIWATSDARLFRELGIPTITFGPGYIEYAHAYNEYVIAKDLAKCSIVYTLSILDFLA